MSDSVLAGTTREGAGLGSFERFQILSLDGGGYRGIFTAAVLTAIEEDLNTRIQDHFDLIAGTSTGGIIAIGLGLGLRPREMLEFYSRFGPRIFPKYMGLASISHWFYRKYSNRQLEVALVEIFGQRVLGESRTRLVIPSFNLGDQDVHLFRTPHAEQLKHDHRVQAWKVAMATSAAPTYFPSFRAVDYMRLIDGGVWANNPAMVACVESMVTLRVPVKAIRLLSIGTCQGVELVPRTLDTGGRLFWARHAARILMKATSQATSNQVKLLLGPKDVVRVDPHVAASELKLDDLRNSDALVGRASHYSRKAMPAISELIGDYRAAPYRPFYCATEESDDRN